MFATIVSCEFSATKIEADEAIAQEMKLTRLNYNSLNENNRKKRCFSPAIGRYMKKTKQIKCN
jgi:hypothetical protein